MEKEYVVRKIDPSTPRRVTSPLGRPPHRRRGRGLPLPLLVGVGVVAVVVIILLLVFKPWKGGGEEEKDAVSSAVSSALPAMGEVVSQPPLDDGVSQAAVEPEEPLPDQLEPDGEPELYDGVAVVDGNGYGLYKFSEDDTNEYIQLVCDAADALPESAALYQMVVPTSLDVMLTENYITGQEIDSSDQRKAIEDYIYPSVHNLSGSVRTVSLFDPLRAHCDEAIYYHSDPLWTQLGAYYGYVEFCAAAGLTPAPIEDFETESYSGYLGGFYQSTGDSSMVANPDTVEAYFPSSSALLSFTDQDGTERTGWPVIQDGDGYDSALLNLIFMAGGQPYAEITNSDLDDGSACIVVGESFTTVFAPFLTSHYQHVYVVDYRYYSGSVPALAEETGATEVILLNTITATSDGGRISDLSSVF